MISCLYFSTIVGALLSTLEIYDHILSFNQIIRNIANIGHFSALLFWFDSDNSRSCNKKYNLRILKWTRISRFTTIFIDILHIYGWVYPHVFDDIGLPIRWKHNNLLFTFSFLLRLVWFFSFHTKKTRHR